MGDTLLEAVKLIREKTGKGVINLNTNASKPVMIKKLFEAGLNSIRVSMNSVQKKYYVRYYNPVDYKYSDVIKSISIAKKNGGFVSVNYLVMPGFTDHIDEVEALGEFLKNTSVDMIQWRNLNYDPLRYYRQMLFDADRSEMIGIDTLIRMVDKEFPNVMKGYFNPSRKE